MIDRGEVIVFLSEMFGYIRATKLLSQSVYFGGIIFCRSWSSTTSPTANWGTSFRRSLRDIPEAFHTFQRSHLAFIGQPVLSPKPPRSEECGDSSDDLECYRRPYTGRIILRRMNQSV